MSAAIRNGNGGIPLASTAHLDDQAFLDTRFCPYMRIELDRTLTMLDTSCSSGYPRLHSLSELI